MAGCERHAERIEESPRRCRVADPRTRRAFTLVEVIVVIVLLAIFATLVAPTILRSAERQAEEESRQVQRLLTVMSERDAVSAEPQALEFDQSSGELRLMVLRSAGGGNDASAWRPDPGLASIVFSSSHIEEARADGRILPRAKWRIVVAPSQPRPSIVIRVALGADSGRFGGSRSEQKASWQVSLGPDAPTAKWAPAASAVEDGTRSVDLDASGRGAKPW